MKSECISKLIYHINEMNCYIYDMHESHKYLFYRSTENKLRLEFPEQNLGSFEVNFTIVDEPSSESVLFVCLLWKLV